MTAPRTAPLTQGQTWMALATHYEMVRTLHLRQLFADDPHRGERLTAEAAGLYLDYSKNRITDETLARTPQRLVAAVMAFGSGVLISALSFDLMDKAYRREDLFSPDSGL